MTGEPPSRFTLHSPSAALEGGHTLAGTLQSAMTSGRGMTATGITHVAAKITPSPCVSCDLTNFQDRLSVVLMALMVGIPIEVMSLPPGNKRR